MLFSTSAMITRYATRRVAVSTGFVVALVVNVVVGLAALGLELAWRARPFAVDAVAVAIFLVAGIFSTFLGRWFFFATVEKLGPARASTWQVTSPLWTALFGFALGDALSAAVVAAMVVTSIGLYLIGTSRRPSTAAPAPARAVLRSGMWLGFFSAIGYAMGNTLRAVAVLRWDEAIAGALLGALAGLVIQLALDAAKGDAVAAIRRADRRGLALYAVIGVVTMCAQTLTVMALARAPAGIVALIVLATPVITFPASFLLLRREEGLTWRTVAGAALALAGLAAVVLH